MNRVDLISESDKAAWNRELDRQRQPVYWTNSKSGTGIPQVLLSIFLLEIGQETVVGYCLRKTSTGLFGHADFMPSLVWRNKYYHEYVSVYRPSQIPYMPQHWFFNLTRQQYHCTCTPAPSSNHQMGQAYLRRSC